MGHNLPKKGENSQDRVEMTVEGRWTVERVFIFHLLATGRKEGMNTENTYTYIHTRRNHHMGCEIAFAESRSETVSLLEVSQEEKIRRLS